MAYLAQCSFHSLPCKTNNFLLFNSISHEKLLVALEWVGLYCTNTE